MTFRVLALALVPGLLFACESTRSADVSRDDGVNVAAPLTDVANAYEVAGRTKVERPASDGPGLHNVRRLGSHIISGSEPDGEEAFAEIAKMGVKTILSVDGKMPDHETAAKYGLRYVHVPIKYSGIAADEAAKIAKTFRELDGPFYVHCFHGKHRGPAAAAIGRLVLDGVSREIALAEMRECGVGKAYEGIYRSIASDEMPEADETARMKWDFPAAHPLGGFREIMIAMPRHFDNLKALEKGGWKLDPAHPDVDPFNEAEKLHDLYTAGERLKDASSRPADFQGWLRESTQMSAELVNHLRALRNGDAAAAERASASMKAINRNCTACHDAYRN